MSALYALAAAVPLIALAVLFRRPHRKKKGADDAPTDAFGYVPSAGRAVDFACGHIGPNAVVYDVYGTKITGRFENGSPNCPDCCLKQMRELIIRCAVCGRPIMPGSVVHLARTPDAKPHWTTDFSGEMVLCNRSDCEAPNVAGRWTGTTVETFY